MKRNKILNILLVLILSFVLASCTKKSNITTKTTKTPYTASFAFNTPVKDEYNLKKMESYYSSFDLEAIKTKSGEELIYYIKSFISNIPYISLKNYGTLRQDLLKTDQSVNSSLYITLFYSREDTTSAWDAGKTWNREHIYPRNIGGFDSDYNKSTQSIVFDLHHVRPVDSSVNSSRSDSPYGEVANKATARQVKTKSGKLAGYLQNDVFEPIDSVKGDVARIIMYVSVCYYLEYSKTVELSDVITNIALALKWNKQDPVDQSEINRNSIAYKEQGNRNIFIDFPEIADLIWG